ncbi:MAG: hypothetical protein AB1333_01645 [Patescibacteria group bacterium]
MTRGVKKFAYGMFYLCIFGLVFYWLFGGLIIGTPTCSDGIQNQNETGIDCGGGCTKCEITELVPLKHMGDVRIFSLDNGKVILLAEILNSNQFFSSDKFSYTFVVYDIRNREIERISGNDAIFALEKKIIFEPRISSSVKDINKIELLISDVSWKKAYETLRSDVVLSSGLETKKTDQGVRVSGSLKNQSSIIASEVRITAILYDQYDMEVFPGQTVLSNLSGLEEKPFVISFPGNKFITDEIDVSRTKVFISTR